MEMPDHCTDCRFVDEIDGTCIALNDGSTAGFHGKPDWCPLEETFDHELLQHVEYTSEQLGYDK